jgi:hypothetical protein
MYCRVWCSHRSELATTHRTTNDVVLKSTSMGRKKENGIDSTAWNLHAPIDPSMPRDSDLARSHRATG